MEENRPYMPINCHFHDSLLDKATLQETVKVFFKLENGEETSVEAKILDVFTKEKVEYMTLSTGETIRLDDLIPVGGLMVPK